MSKLFIFVDESGDPGYPDQNSSTSYYNLNILITDQEGIFKINEAISRLRYYLNLNKELKTYWYKNRVRPKIIDAIESILMGDNSIRTFIFTVDKQKYTGPYLSDNPTNFRNFILRQSLERVFEGIHQELHDSFELVIDRYLESADQQENLRTYLHESYTLPRSKEHISKIHHIIHVQSVYSDIIQFIDIVGRYFVDEPKVADLLTSVDMSEIKKGPGHSM
jgi:Protein of unknown function (DUF3800)